jgi:signal transduction histidine kinase
MRYRLGIRGQLAAVAVLLTLMTLVVGRLSADRLERLFKAEQEEAITLSARALAAALSDRPQLFARSEESAAEEERRRIVALFAASDPDTVAALGNTYAPVPVAENLIALAARSAARVFLVDQSHRVRALSGNIVANDRRSGRVEVPGDRWFEWITRPLARLLSRPADLPQGGAREQQVERALDGRPSVVRRAASDGRGTLLAAAQPVFAGDQIVAAVVVEESAESLSAARATALESGLLLAISVLAMAVLALSLFATGLVRRIVRLSRAADAAIDAQGRIRSAADLPLGHDELGDLARGMQAMFARLARYNAYLEALAGRLAHELRTPLAIVRSSLDNLRLAAPEPAAMVYVERASGGIDRLANLISRLGEATRLEQFLAEAKTGPVNLTHLLTELAQAYRGVYPAFDWTLAVPAAAVIVHGVADALQQLLDKLADNAASFSAPGSAIELHLEARGPGAVLSVLNRGPLLPPQLQGDLFSSMVSVRESPGERGGGHLGLGLYIVRLVAEFHGGRVGVENRGPHEGDGVAVRVWLPMR